MELFARDQELVRQAAEGVRALHAAQAAAGGTHELMRQAMEGIKALQQVQQAQAATGGAGVAPGGVAVGDGQQDGKAQAAQLHIAANAAFEAIERVDAERAAAAAATAAAVETGTI